MARVVGVQGSVSRPGARAALGIARRGAGDEFARFGGVGHDLLVDETRTATGWLADLARDLAGVENDDDAIRIAFHVASRQLECSDVRLYQLDASGVRLGEWPEERWIDVDTRCLADRPQTRSTISIVGTALGQCVSERARVVVADGERGPRGETTWCDGLGSRPGSRHLLVPLVSRGRCFAVLVLGRRAGPAFRLARREEATLVAALLAGVVHQSTRFEPRNVGAETVRPDIPT